MSDSINDAQIKALITQIFANHGLVISKDDPLIVFSTILDVLISRMHHEQGILLSNFEADLSKSLSNFLNDPVIKNKLSSSSVSSPSPSVSSSIFSISSKAFLLLLFLSLFFSAMNLFFLLYFLYFHSAV